MSEATATDTGRPEAFAGPAARPDRAAPAPSGHTAGKARVAIVGMLVLGLLIATGSRQWALGLQRQAHLTGPYAPAEGSEAAGEGPVGSAGPTIGSLDSYFLILVLGGLRGPLVMFLWTSSEHQKNERDLEDFDTKVELIRLLQPEFDSVHVFQMWNKAYNISAQIASLPNKYAVILDAVEYGKSVDRSRPNNLNILLELNKIFQHKLGTTTNDSDYYRQEVRKDSKWRETKDDGVGALDRRMAPILDPQDNVLPELVRPRTSPQKAEPARIVLPVAALDAVKAAADKAGIALPPDQINPPAGARELVLSIPEPDARKIDPLLEDNILVRFIYADWNDGSDLQYLKKYEPYPYGVSPLALGYNYGKRAQVLMNRTGQRPTQSGPSVVDSRPGLELKHWADVEWDRAIVAEARAFGQPVVQKNLSKTRHGMLLTTATVPPSAAALDPADVREALFSFDLARRLLRDSRAEFTRHLLNTTVGIRRMQDYSSHLDGLEADELMVTADLRYLQAVVEPDSARKRSLLEEAAGKYRQARARYAAMDLRYYTPGETDLLLFPPDPDAQHLIPDWRTLLTMAGFPEGINRENAKKFIDQPEKLRGFHDFVVWGLEAMSGWDQNKPERMETGFFLLRIDLRQSMIAQALNPSGPRQQIRPIPDLWPPPEAPGPQ